MRKAPIRNSRLFVALVLLAASASIAETSSTPIRAVVVAEEQPDHLTVLDRRGDRWLVEGTPEQLSAWPDAIPAPLAPTRPLASTRTWSPVKQADPLIQSLVDQVLWDDLLDDVEWIVNLGVRYSLHANIDVVADSLAARFEALGLPTEKHQFPMYDANPYNVIATQTGTVHPDSIFVVCGHYDAISEAPNTNTPGADDNASGTCAVLTCARLFAPFESAYTIQYVLFAGEELGLHGSSAWVGRMAAEGANIVGAMNVDMIGWCGRFAPFDLEIETDAHSRWMADAIVDAADLYTDMPYILHQDDSAWWGDFYSFWQHGYCAVNHEESWDWGDPDFNPYYHTVNDLPIWLNPDFMTGSVKVVAAGLATLAQVSDPLVAVPDRPAAGLRLSASPNPFNGRTTLHLELEGATGAYAVEIFDVAGRRVGRETVALANGRGTTTWSAIGPSGESLASGMYLARVGDVEDRSSCRLVYVR
ncbi:M28 family peptidase [bacterium]|nr:M28 family peptidase [bacterium]